MPEQRFIDQKEPPGTHSFIQWKGTDVCMDIWCDCGWAGHYDGYFAYTWQCPECNTVWEAPDYISYRKNKRPDNHVFVSAMELRAQE